MSTPRCANDDDGAVMKQPQSFWYTVVLLCNFDQPFWRNVWTTPTTKKDKKTHSKQQQQQQPAHYLRLFLLFGLLQSLALWGQLIHGATFLFNVPSLFYFLWPVSPDSLEQTRVAHGRCLASVCAAVRNVSFACTVDRWGTTRLDTDRISGQGIPLTDECRTSLLPSLDDDVSPFFAGSWLLRFPTATSEPEPPTTAATTTTNDNGLALVVLSPSCEGDVIDYDFSNVPDYEITGNATTTNYDASLYSPTPTKGSSVPLVWNPRPNSVEEFELEHYFCYDSLGDDHRVMVDGFVRPAYDWWLKYHPPVLAMVILPLVALVAALGPLIVTALLRTMVMYSGLSVGRWWWPNSPHPSDGDTITFGSMFRALLLLDSILHSPWWIGIVLALTAYYYRRYGRSSSGCGDKKLMKAAINWSKLFYDRTIWAAFTYQEAMTFLRSLMDGNHAFSIPPSLAIDCLLWLTPGEGPTKFFGVIAIVQIIRSLRQPPQEEAPSAISASFSLEAHPQQQNRTKMD
jgi:hypothetical protein